MNYHSRYLTADALAQWLISAIMAVMKVYIEQNNNGRWQVFNIIVLNLAGYKELKLLTDPHKIWSIILIFCYLFLKTQ